MAPRKLATLGICQNNKVRMPLKDVSEQKKYTKNEESIQTLSEVLDSYKRLFDVSAERTLSFSSPFSEACLGKKQQVGPQKKRFLILKMQRTINLQVTVGVNFISATG